MKERIQGTDKDLFNSMKKRLKTFSGMRKMVRMKVKGKEVELKSDMNLMARLVIIGRARQIDLNLMMQYCLVPFSTRDGCLVKTNKANLQHAVEALQEKPVKEV